MKLLLSIFVGVLAGVGTTLIHPSIQPLGTFLAVIATHQIIWWVGFHYGKRRYRIYAFIAWMVVIMRAGSFGVGQELLIQGDGAGSAFLTLGFLSGLLAIFRKV